MPHYIYSISLWHISCSDTLTNSQIEGNEFRSFKERAIYIRWNLCYNAYFILQLLPCNDDRMATPRYIYALERAGVTIAARKREMPPRAATSRSGCRHCYSKRSEGCAFECDAREGVRSMRGKWPAYVRRRIRAVTLEAAPRARRDYRRRKPKIKCRHACARVLYAAQTKRRPCNVVSGTPARDIVPPVLNEWAYAPEPGCYVTAPPACALRAMLKSRKERWTKHHIRIPLSSPLPSFLPERQSPWWRERQKRAAPRRRRKEKECQPQRGDEAGQGGLRSRHARKRGEIQGTIREWKSAKAIWKDYICLHEYTHNATPCHAISIWKRESLYMLYTPEMLRYYIALRERHYKVYISIRDERLLFMHTVLYTREVCFAARHMLKERPSATGVPHTTP